MMRFTQEKWMTEFSSEVKELIIIWKYIYIYIRYVRPHRHVPEKNEFAISPQGLRLKFPIFDRGEQAVSRAGSLAPIF